MRRSRRDLEQVYAYFPRLKERRELAAGYTSGGEQQMCAIGRALMARPKMILLDEPSMGLAPQIVEEIFEIVGDLNEQGGRDLPARRAEHQHGAALRRLRLHPRERPRRDGRRRRRRSRENEDVKEFYLGIAEGKRKSFATPSTTAAANAGWRSSRAVGWANALAAASIRCVTSRAFAHADLG